MTDLLTTISLLFIFAGPFLLLANRYDLPTVPFLILAGVVAGFVVDEGLTLELAQFGIALLVFTFGIRVDLASSQLVLGDSETAALAQILGVGGLGVAFGLLVGVPAGEALFLGVAAAFSSTIVGTALIEVEIRRQLVRARLAESVQFVQDLVALIIVLVIGAGTLAADPIATQLGYGVSLLLAALLVNRYLFERIDHLAAGSDELMIIGTVSLLVLFVAAAELVGISIVVGAFAAGLAIRHEPVEYAGLFNGIVSLRDFFLAIFFVTIGALVVVPFVEMGVTESLEKLLLVGGLVLLTAVVKPLVTTLILLHRGYEARTASLTSLSIDQVSEFALIIAIEAVILGLLSTDVFDVIILAAAITMATSSVTQRYDEDIYRILSDRIGFEGTHRKIERLSAVPDDISDHVIIVGYGRKGRVLADTCRGRDHPVVVIENDPAQHEAVTEDCEAYVFGDAMESYTWEKANVKDATLIISAVTSTPISNRLLSFDFGADLVLHTGDVKAARSYLDRGAIYVTVPDILAGEELARQLQELFDNGTSPTELREQRRAELESFAAVVHRRLERHTNVQ